MVNAESVKQFVFLIGFVKNCNNIHQILLILSISGFILGVLHTLAYNACIKAKKISRPDCNS